MEKQYQRLTLVFLGCLVLGLVGRFILPQMGVERWWAVFSLVPFLVYGDNMFIKLLRKEDGPDEGFLLAWGTSHGMVIVTLSFLGVWVLPLVGMELLAFGVAVTYYFASKGWESLKARREFTRLTNELKEIEELCLRLGSEITEGGFPRFLVKPSWWVPPGTRERFEEWWPQHLKYADGEWRTFATLFQSAWREHSYHPEWGEI